jgi:hypothetical protein
MKAESKSIKDKNALLRQKPEGALILPTNDGLGDEIIRYSSIANILTGEAAIAARLGEDAQQASVYFTDDKQMPRLLKMPPGLFYKAYAAARAGHLVNCQGHCEAVPYYVAPPSGLSGDIGKKIDDKGIYMGVWEPKDRKGNSMSRAFDVYAAPSIIRIGESNTPLAMTFNDASTYVRHLKDWHGHNGSELRNDSEIIHSIRNGYFSRLRSWFIPTRELLWGKNHRNEHCFATPLVEIYNFGAFKGLFDISEPYWSCTVTDEKKDHVHGVRLTPTKSGLDGVDDNKFFTLPVRAELRRS